MSAPSAEQFDELVCAYLDKALTKAQEAELLELLEQPALAQRFLELTRLDGQIAALSAAPVSDERMLGNVKIEIERELSGKTSGRTSSIMAGISGRPRAKEAPGDAEETVENRGRRKNRFRRAEKVSGFSSAPVAVAALLVIMVGLFVIYQKRNPQQSTPVVVKTEPPKQKPEVVDPNDPISESKTLPPQRTTPPVPPSRPEPKPAPEVKTPAPTPEPENPVVPPPTPEPAKTPQPEKEPVRPAPTPKNERPVLPETKVVEAKKEPAKRVRAAELRGVEGDAFIVSGDKKTAAKSGAEVFFGDGIETAAGGKVDIVYPDQTAIALAPETKVAQLLGSAAPQGGEHYSMYANELTLLSGNVEAIVAKQKPGKALAIKTPTTLIEVIGTRFTVSATSKETRLDVSEGRVKLTRTKDTKSVTVDAGSYVVADEKAPLQVAKVEVPKNGLKLWLAADQKVMADKDGFVSKWPDLSGNGNDAIARPKDSFPRLDRDAANRPVIRFDGKDDYFEIKTLTGAMDNFTIVWALYPVKLIEFNQVIAGSAGFGEFLFNTTPTGGVVAGTTMESRIVPGTQPGRSPHGTIVVDTWQVLTYVYNGTTGTFYKNGKQMAQKEIVKPKPWTGFKIGQHNKNTIHGDMPELLLYTVPLPDNDRMAAERYLMAKYGVKP